MAQVTTDGTRYGWQCAMHVNGYGAMVHTKNIHADRATAQEFADVHNALYHA